VVGAMAQVVMNSKLINQKLNLCGPEKIPFEEVIDRLVKCLGCPGHKVYIPVWLAKWGVSLASLIKIGSFIPDQIPRLLCSKNLDISKTSALISYFPRKLEEGLRRYL
jgi:hypothetical protein